MNQTTDRKIKISCVSYLNSKPFIYGLQNSEIKNEIDLELDTPALCAQKLMEGKVDIGLVPVAILPELKEYFIISDYCIGADGEVGSVLLLSEVPLEKIETILLDYQSRTSVMLAKILAEKFWKIKPKFVDASENFEKNISGNIAAVVIGDRTFSLKDKFKFAYDLSEEWKKFTQLPFVFACWVSNKMPDKNFVIHFNEALRYGLRNVNAVVEDHQKEFETFFDVKDYLEKKISYSFDEKKKFALEFFLKYAAEEMKKMVLRP